MNNESVKILRQSTMIDDLAECVSELKRQGYSITHMDTCEVKGFHWITIIMEYEEE